MKHILIAALILLCHNSRAQEINLNQQYSFGGSGNDNLRKTIRLSNGNYILFGTSDSPPSGTKTSPSYGLTDWWIVCLDANYTELWQKTLGGTMYDDADGVKELNNGDLLFFGISNSPANGNKQSVNQGSFDYWLIRMTNTGTIIWDKTYGGDDIEMTPDVLELSGGNLIVTGASQSGISGNKTSASFGLTDVWMLKLDANGTIIQQAVYGGDSPDDGNILYQLNSNEFIVVAGSQSGVSGNKTEPNFGGVDLWILKIDSSFNLLSQKVIGGSSTDFTSAFIPLMNGNFLLTSTSASPAGGMKSENGYGSNDAWLIELDPTFNVIRDKTIGGNAYDSARKTYQLANGKILVLISSPSLSNIYKSENSIGAYDYWIVLLDENWNVIYENTIGSTGDERIQDMIQKDNGEMVFFGRSNGGINNDKTCETNGQNDFWVIAAETDLSVNANELIGQVLYPNPTGSAVYFKTPGFNNTDYHVLDLSGKTVLTGTVNNDRIDLDQLQTGTYFIRIKNTHYKVIKQ